MSELTRRRDMDSAREKWSILYRDVCVGSIGLRSSVHNRVDQLEWKCGFYPGCDPGQQTSGSADSFGLARTAFEAAWQRLLPTRAEADIQAWRDQQNWTERKFALWTRGERLASQQPSSLMRCPCGACFDSHVPAENLIHGPHIYAEQPRDGMRL
ncbi:hypothetical protein JQ633_01435 [Bradyrhizobium tropiciagri]|uniref:hypothetical protein n=1 Tax=Bradyrhizobium tropiciagri TaxID=312253 RepID=UPI001BA69191|nr:hypothetical protein [Bradyrhizobium tropiciagri]MBR0869004.1 hypothetical protein [Bradyrhizobium tropiciagri]